MPPTPSTKPLGGGRSNVERVFDRQIRLWGPHGQRLLSSANVLFVGSDAAISEALKSLLLTGISAFTIVDDALVTQADLGCNFFVAESDVGLSRARSVAELAGELNPSAAATVLCVSPDEFVNAATAVPYPPSESTFPLTSGYKYVRTRGAFVLSPPFSPLRATGLSEYSLIIADRYSLLPTTIAALDAYLSQCHDFPRIELDFTVTENSPMSPFFLRSALPPLLVICAAGLVSSVWPSHGTRCALETHSNPAPPIRDTLPLCASAWTRCPELVWYAWDPRFDVLEEENPLLQAEAGTANQSDLLAQHGQIPFPVILVREAYRFTGTPRPVRPPPRSKKTLSNSPGYQPCTARLPVPVPHIPAARASAFAAHIRDRAWLPRDADAFEENFAEAVQHSRGVCSEGGGMHKLFMEVVNSERARRAHAAAIVVAHAAAAAAAADPVDPTAESVPAATPARAPIPTPARVPFPDLDLDPDPVSVLAPIPAFGPPFPIPVFAPPPTASPAPSVERDFEEIECAPILPPLPEDIAALGNQRVSFAHAFFSESYQVELIFGIDDIDAVPLGFLAKYASAADHILSPPSAPRLHYPSRSISPLDVLLCALRCFLLSPSAGAGRLPLPPTLPDMASATANYVDLKKVIQSKSDRDFARFETLFAAAAAALLPQHPCPKTTTYGVSMLRKVSMPRMSAGAIYDAEAQSKVFAAKYFAGTMWGVDDGVAHFATHCRGIRIVQQRPLWNFSAAATAVPHVSFPMSLLEQVAQALPPLSGFSTGLAAHNSDQDDEGLLHGVPYVSQWHVALRAVDVFRALHHGRLPGTPPKTNAGEWNWQTDASDMRFLHMAMHAHYFGPDEFYARIVGTGSVNSSFSDCSDDSREYERIPVCYPHCAEELVRQACKPVHTSAAIAGAAAADAAAKLLVRQFTPAQGEFVYAGLHGVGAVLLV